MKKIVKIIGLIVLALIVVVGVFAAIIASSDIPSYEKGDLKLKVEISPEKIERGRVLVGTLCASCHKDNQTGRMTGKRMMDVPEEFGVVYSPNITKNKENGIGEYTDGELVYLLRTGIKKNGQYCPPYMPKFPNMADEDINSIVAFLRSDDNLVADDPTPDKACEPSFLNKMLCRVAFKPFELPTEYIEMPDTNNTVEWGKYLAHNFDCFSCHSYDFKTNDYLNPEKSEGYFAGGNKTLDQEGKNVIQTQNLTPDEKTGIGAWTEEQFIKAVKYGQKEGEHSLRYPMIPYVLLSDSEISAIYKYLMTIPPIENEIPRSGL